jgi:hypothetical protein
MFDSKKRDKKVADKKDKHVPGTVSFGGGESKDKKKPSRDFGNKDKKDYVKKDFKSNKFQKSGSKSPYKGKTPEGSVDKDRKPKTGGDKEEDKSASQIRRAKSKISDLKKKLMVNYGKLIMKKADIGLENKQELVKENLELINHKFEDLIYKHDGCRIVQQMIKHGSKEQK